MWSGRDDGAAVARMAGADAFFSKQRMSRSKTPGGEILAIVDQLWRADVRHEPHRSRKCCCAAERSGQRDVAPRCNELLRRERWTTAKRILVTP